MGEAAKSMARDLVVATGASCPVQAHRFAIETGFVLRPASGESHVVGDVFEYNATVPMDEQESAILELMARWLLEHVGEAVTAESVAELLDMWLGANGDVGDASGSGSLTGA